MNNVYMYRKRANMGDNYASSVLAKEMGITNFLDPTSTQPPQGSIILNWGISKRPGWMYGGVPVWPEYRDNYKVTWVNVPLAVGYSSNKIHMLYRFETYDVPTLCWATTPEGVGGGDTVVRHQIHSHSGNGIEIIKEGDPLPLAPLYTRLERFEAEQRYFVVGNKVVDVVQKKRMGKAKREALGIKLHPTIKSRKRGWIFAHNDIIPPTQECINAAINAMGATGLDFGVVDIAFNDPSNPVVIETNSAPGLRSKTTIIKLASALRSYIEDL